MLCIGDLKTLREAYSATSDVTRDEAMRQIGAPSEAEIIAFALQPMSSAHRNTRVLALRVLARHSGDDPMRGVLAGLRDDKRRVRAVAIQACGSFLHDDAIVARLEAIVRAAKTKRKLRRRALSMLAGDEGRLRGDLTPAQASALRRLMQAPEFRFDIVFGLARLDLGARVKSLLLEFAAAEDDSERAMAARALAGERVIHLDAYAADEAEQRRVMANCDVAHGRMYYWRRRAGWTAETPA